MWPLTLLVLVEAGSYYFLTSGSPLQSTPLSFFVAGLIFFTGLLPPLLNPTSQSVVAGCFSTILACILFIPPQDMLTPFPVSLPEPQPLMAVMTWRAVNIAFLAPIALNLSLSLRRTNKVFNLHIGWLYALTAIQALVLIFIPPNPAWLILRNFFMAWMFVLIGIAIYQLYLLGRQTEIDRSQEARQARLLLFCVFISQSPGILRILGLTAGRELVSYPVLLGAEILLPFGVVYTILRHELFQIDSLIRRASGYALVSLVMVTAYFSLTLAVTTWLGETWADKRDILTILGILVAALIFRPLQGRFQGLIDKWFYPERYRFAEVISSAQQAIGGVVRREEVVRVLNDFVPKGIEASWSKLVFSSLPELSGEENLANAWSFPLMVADKCLGGYWLGQRRSGLPYDEREKSQLQALIQQASLAFAYADTLEALEQLNSQLEERVEERTLQVIQQKQTLAVIEERQKLARTLHDSISQTLFSIILGTRAVRLLLQKNPSVAMDELKALEAGAQSAQYEMRTLLNQLKNPENDIDLPGVKADLVLLVADHCKKLAQMPGKDGNPLLRVELDLPQKLDLPAVMADEIYQIAREALHNVVKHSGVSKARCSLLIDNGHVVLVVADEGNGFSDPEDGMGLSNMKNRCDGLGGQLLIRSHQGSGTIIEARIPLVEEII